MADIDSSQPTLNETTDNSANNDTNVNNVNNADSSDNFAVEGAGKYGDSFGGGGNQNPESTDRRGNTSGATPI